MNESDIPEFGIKREGEERRDGGCGVVYDPVARLFAVGKQHDGGVYRLFSGGVDASEDIQIGVMREVQEESGLHNFSHIEKIAEAFSHYHNTLRNVNRIAKATCFLVILENADLMPVQLEDHEKFSLAWVTEQELRDNWNQHNANKDYDHWMYFLDRAVMRMKELGYQL